MTLTQFTDQSETVALAAIRAGRVAGYALPPPLLAVHRADGLHVLVEGEQLDYHYQRPGLVTTRRFVEDNREIALDVVRATLDAIARMKQDPQGVGAVLTKYMTLDPETDAADLAAMYDDNPHAPGANLCYTVCGGAHARDTSHTAGSTRQPLHHCQPA